MRLSRLLAIGSLIVAGCSLDDYDPAEVRFTGEAAKQRIEYWADSQRNPASLPESARNFYIYDGGNVFGSIVYVSFDCGSREDCWTAVKHLGGPDSSEFKPWVESQYAVVMRGPGYYHESHKGDPWDVRGIKDGMVYERVKGDHEWMFYYAVDSDRNRVYYHRESGGFRPDPYSPKDDPR